VKEQQTFGFASASDVFRFDCAFSTAADGQALQA